MPAQAMRQAVRFRQVLKQISPIVLLLQVLGSRPCKQRLIL
jgi:hypothetical protein